MNQNIPIIEIYEKAATAKFNARYGSYTFTWLFHKKSAPASHLEKNINNFFTKIIGKVSTQQEIDKWVKDQKEKVKEPKDSPSSSKKRP